jgi:hypothetical protein
MALLKAAPGREAGGYERLFGDAKLGRLLSRVQSAVIRAGAELEQVIIELANTIDDADAFLDADILQEGVFAVSKKVLKKSKRLNYAGVEPDFVVFKREGKTQHCYLIELKDGDTAIAPHIQFTMSNSFLLLPPAHQARDRSGFQAQDHDQRSDDRPGILRPPWR